MIQDLLHERAFIQPLDGRAATCDAHLGLIDNNDKLLGSLLDHLQG